MAQMEILGVDAVTETLKQVSPREGKGIARRTITKVAASVRDDMRQRAPHDEGTLRKAIKSRRSRSHGSFIRAAIYITHGKRATRDAFYWHWLEFGSSDMLPKPFIQPTVEAWRGEVEAEWARQWWPQYEKEMAKRARKQAGLK